MDPDQKAVAEYKAAQDSAQHHDNLLWYVSSIVWAGNLVLLGSVLQRPREGERPFQTFAVALFCICLNLFVWGAAALLRSIRNWKYRRCQEIEEDLNFRQHRELELKYPVGLMWTLYSIVIMLFLVVWLVIAVGTWSQHS